MLSPVPREGAIPYDNRSLDPGERRSFSAISQSLLNNPIEPRLNQRAGEVDRPSIVDGVYGHTIDSVARATKTGNYERQNPKVAPRPEPSIANPQIQSSFRPSAKSGLAKVMSHPRPSSSDLIQTPNTEFTAIISEGPKAQDGHQPPIGKHSVAPRTSNGLSKGTSETASSVQMAPNSRRQALPVSRDDQVDAGMLPISSHPSNFTQDALSAPRPSAPENSLSEHLTDSGQYKDTAITQKTNNRSHLRLDSSDSIQTPNTEFTAIISRDPKAQDGHQLPVGKHSVPPKASNGVGKATSDTASTIQMARNSQQQAVPERRNNQVGAGVAPILSHPSNLTQDASSVLRPSGPESSLSEHLTDSGQYKDTATTQKTNNRSHLRPSGSNSIQAPNPEPTAMISESPKAEDRHQLPAGKYFVPPKASNGVGKAPLEAASSNRRQLTGLELGRRDSEVDARVLSISSHPSNFAQNGPVPRPSTPASSISDHTLMDTGQGRDGATTRKTNKISGFLKGLSGIGSTERKSSTPSESETSYRVVKAVKTAVSWVAKRIDVDNLQIQDTVIAVMGPTGAGKSSFINMVVTADGEDAETSVKVGHTLASCTSEITMVELRDPSSNSRIVLVDTPGFDDTEKSDTEILGMVADWLEKTYKKDVKLAGIIYMHRISDNRMAGTPLKNLEMFKTLCGKHALKNVVLATTMWDEVEKEQGEQREIELRNKYWKGMLDAGSKTFRYARNQESAWTIAEHFIDPYVSYALQLQQVKTVVHQQQTKLPVQLQRELVDDKTPLRETQAGQQLLFHLDDAIARQQSTLKRLQKDSDQLPEKALSALLAEFETQREEIRKLMEQAETLRLPFTRRVIRVFTSPLRRRS